MAVHPVALLSQWLDAHRDRLLAMEIVFSLEEAVGGGSGRIDFDSRSALARVTVWAEGFCDAEAVELETSERLYDRHAEGIGQDCLAVQLEGLVECLSAFGGFGPSRS